MKKENHIKVLEFWSRHKIPYVWDETLSLYQLVRKTIQYLNKVIEDQNELKDIIKDFIQAFDEDVQDTVIKVLEQWKDDGTLGEIVNQALIEIDEIVKNKADKSDLQSFRDLTDINIDEITYIDNNEKTECVLIKIPKKYKIRYDVTDKKDPANNLKTAKEFNKIKNASIVINASQGGKLGFRSYNVANGIIYQDYVESGFTHIKPLAINDNNDFKTIDPSDDIYKVVGDGYKTVISGFEPFIENGKNIVPNHNGLKQKHPRQVIGKDTSGNIFILTVKGRTNESVGMNSSDIQKLLHKYLNVDYAYMLDGGGSTQTLLYGVNVADPLDSDFSVDRPRPDFIYFVNEQDQDKDKYEKNKQAVLSILNSQVKELWGYVERDKTRSSLHLKTDGIKATGLGREKNGKMINKLNLNDDGFSLYDYNKGSDVFKFSDGKVNIAGKQVNTIFNAPLWKESGSANDIEAGFMYCSNAVKNLPDQSAWWVFAVKQSEGSAYYVAQIAIPLGKNRKIMFRNKEGTNWSEWE